MKLATTICFIAIILLLDCTAKKSVVEDPGLQQLNIPLPDYELLFNGKNLDGWYVVLRDNEKEGDIFTVHDGILHAYENKENRSAQSFAGIITENRYSRYDLSFEYKWGEKKFQPRHEFVRDAGIIFHMHGEDIIWPNGVECQIQEGDTGDLWVIGTKVSSKVNSTIRNYSPEGKLETRGGGKRFHRFHRGYFWEVPGWNKIEVQVRGDYAKFIVNGKIVNEAIDMKYFDEANQEWKPLTEGKILLQAEGAEIYYRNIQIKKL